MQAAPSELPAPIDDGACDHLPGLALPAIALPSTAGRFVELDKLEVVRTVIYCYPMTGVPGVPLPEGWDLIPGARGCTPPRLAPFAITIANLPASRLNSLA